MKKPIIKYSTNANDFVGIRIENNKPVVIFPHGVKLRQGCTNKELKEYILYLTKAIFDSSKFKEEENDFNKLSSSFIKHFPLYDYLWILNDYINNGIYSSKEKQYKKNLSGKVNWKKTIDGDKIFHRNSIFFHDIYSQKTVLEDNFLTQIHQYCLEEANDICGWFFGNINIPTSHISFFNQKQAIYYLKNKLTKIFDDRTRILMKVMINILKFRTGKFSLTRTYEYGTYNFEYVWESIIHKLFNNTVIEKYYQSANYIINNNKYDSSSRLRPDSLLVKDSRAFLIDSKYYRFGMTYQINHLPGTSDIQKQVAYGEYVNSILEPQGYKTFNMFILPYNKSEVNVLVNNRGLDIEHIGIARPKWLIKSNFTDYNNVHIILMDGNYALKNYSNISKDSVHKLLIKQFVI